MARRPTVETRRTRPRPLLNRVLSVSGFKSVRDETSIEIAPLTLLCGGNSSGKSAFMQPLLLIKQTLEVGYDPGPLLLHGPNVSFGKISEMLWRGKARQDVARHFSVALRDHDNEQTKLTFGVGSKGLSLTRFDYEPSDEDQPASSFSLTPNMPHDEIYGLLEGPFQAYVDQTSNAKLEVRRQRCFFDVRLVTGRSAQILPSPSDTSALMNYVATRLLHLPGLRDLPERLYPATQAGEVFPGPFHPYVASVIASWVEKDDVKWHRLNEDLHQLGLTWKVDAKRVDDTKVALRVGRLPNAQRGGAMDMVNLADVGLGVSQTLPVLVALLIAGPGQIVYLEQPEIHLHPRAQVALGNVLMAAARRGVHVVCETHSHLLVRSIQAAAAKSSDDARLVRMHWFSRDDSGVTQVASTGLDEIGAYGELPLDFNDVEEDLENDYLDIIQAEW